VAGVKILIVGGEVLINIFRGGGWKNNERKGVRDEKFVWEGRKENR
jgi:hypothetical protein